MKEINVLLTNSSLGKLFITSTTLVSFSIWRICSFKSSAVCQLEINLILVYTVPQFLGTNIEKYTAISKGDLITEFELGYENRQFIGVYNDSLINILPFAPCFVLPSGSRNQGDPTINSYNQKAKHKANQTITLTAVITRSVEQQSTMYMMYTLQDFKMQRHGGSYFRFELFEEILYKLKSSPHLNLTSKRLLTSSLYLRSKEPIFKLLWLRDLMQVALLKLSLSKFVNLLYSKLACLSKTGNTVLNSNHVNQYLTSFVLFTNSFNMSSYLGTLWKSNNVEDFLIF